VPLIKENDNCIWNDTHMKLLITGASGYIGRNVSRYFLDRGIEVVGFDLTEFYLPAKLPNGFKFVQGNINSREDLDKLQMFDNFSAILHFAALKSVEESFQYPESYMETNVLGTQEVVDFAHRFGIKTVINFSSAAVYGDVQSGIAAEDRPGDPLSPYGESKLRAEDFGKIFAVEKNLNFISLRLFNVGGAYKKELQDRGTNNIIPIFINALKEKVSPKIFGNSFDTPDGTCLRDYVHVNDICIVIEKLLKLKELPSQDLILNVGTGIGTSVFQVFQEISKQLGQNIQPTFQKERVGDAPKLIADTDKINHLLKFKPEASIEKIISSIL
jgi:UDP-glucose 4-epimerase